MNVEPSWKRKGKRQKETEREKERETERQRETETERDNSVDSKSLPIKTSRCGSGLKPKLKQTITIIGKHLIRTTR